MKRIQPKIPFGPLTFQIVSQTGPKTITIELNPVAGNTSDTRKAQSVSVYTSIAEGPSEVAHVLYLDARKALYEDRPEAIGLQALPVSPDGHDRFRAALEHFICLVETAIPMDLQNVSAEMGNEFLRKVWALPSTYAVEQRLTGRVPVTSEEVLIVLDLFPYLDLKATLCRQAWLRQHWRDGGTAPQHLKKYAASRGWE